MRLQSPFKDYYDGAINIGGAPDPRDPLYIRITKKFEMRDLSEKVKKRIKKWGWPKSFTNKKTKNGKEYSFSICSFGCVFFCGKMYQFAETRKVIIPFSEIAETRICWSLDELKAQVDNAGLKDKFQEFLESRPIYSPATNEKIFEIFFTKGMPDNKDINGIMESPIVLVKGDDYYNWGRYASIITINPKLVDLRFASVLDPYTLAQELGMYYDAKFSMEKENPMVNVSDIDRLKAHGFDPKTSFRKPKEKK